MIKQQHISGPLFISGLRSLRAPKCQARSVNMFHKVCCIAILIELYKLKEGADYKHWALEYYRLLNHHRDSFTLVI